MAKLNQFHIDKTIDSHSHLTKKKYLLAYYSQSNQEMVVGKAKLHAKLVSEFAPVGMGLKRRQK